MAMRSSKGFPILPGFGGSYRLQVCDEDSTEIIRQSKEVVPPVFDGMWEDHLTVATEQSHRQAYSLRTTLSGDVRFRIFLALTCFCFAFIFYQSKFTGMGPRLVLRS